MKKLLLIAVVFIFGVSAIAQVKLSTAYNYDQNDSVLSGLKSIRGVYYAADPFGTGQSAIVATNYNQKGVVNLFVAAGNDSLELVWTSPFVAANGGGSTPRYPLIADLDNDGLVEIIYQSSGNGIYIYEWDGVQGSYNFGTQPSQLIDNTTLAGVSGNCEYMEVLDIDGDLENELLVAYNSSPSANDRYYIISAVGDWATDNPGFSGFNKEFEGVRTELGNYGLSGGSPYAMISAQLDGSGNKEVLIHNWNLKNVTPLRVTGPNTYVMADTTTGKANLFLSTTDDVALFSGLAYDIDKDGRDEVYLPTFPSSGSPLLGKVSMISYDANQSTDMIDSSNVFNLDLSSVNGGTTFGYGYGDIDNNGKPNLYFSGSYPFNVVTAEFQGGDKKDQNNWVVSLLYAGEPTIFSSMTIKDSAGVVDTAFTVNGAFASKIWGRSTDFDKDGKEDIVLPYQALNDSIDVSTLTWNGAQFDTVKSKVVNPKRWGLRIIESDAVTGISSKDLTVITPEDFTLEQNYPNPFNPSTNIKFTLPLNKKVSLKIYDILGNEVATLINNQEFSKGTHEVTWNGRNNAGAQVASGTYIYQLRFGNFTKSLKMMLLK